MVPQEEQLETGVIMILLRPQLLLVLLTDAFFIITFTE